MRVVVRKCPFTGKLFEEKDISKYILHLQQVRDEKKELREYARLKAGWEKWLRAEQAKVRSFAEIAPWILENQNRLIRTYNAFYAPKKKKDYSWNRPFPRGSKFLSINMRANFSELASNSHCAPRGGKMNWCGRNDPAPRGYPGWTGSLSGKLDITERQESPSWSEFFKLFDVHTGTGSGGSSFQYSVTVFASDWPGVAEELTFRKLATGSMS
jgi:hypothetical protein